ncbi:MAG: Abortive infection protein [Edaphobacter sp.]|nr:Abortive infection protein [Edaphobacter sp.]
MPAFDSTPPARSSRTLQLALFLTSVAWVVCSQALAGRAARGIAMRFDFASGEFLLRAVFLLFLLAVGFSILQTIAHGSGSLREALGLPRRPTAGREWAVGASIGWGIVVLSVVPMALAGALHISVWTAPRAFWLAILNLAAIAVAALAEEVAFRGYPYRRLIEAIGPAGATIAMSIVFGLLHMFNPDATWISVLITMLAGLLLSVAWLRTHGLWLAWGLHFGWNASMGVLFGLPVSGITNFSTVIQTRAIGRTWLTGGDYGPEAAFFTALVLLMAIGVLVRVTRDYAWYYTHPPIVPAGYPMDVAPPEAHTAMEQQASPASLVQILPTTPQSRSVEEKPNP